MLTSEVADRARESSPIPDVAILVLNFNGYRDTKRALQSLRHVTRLSIRAIVIDNGSERDEARILADEFPEAIVERSAENVGFSRGVNRAAEIAFTLRAQHLLLLNNDAWLEDPDLVLCSLVGALRADSNIAAAGPLVLEDDGSQRVQSAGYRFSLWWPLPRAVRRITASPAFTYLSACCLMIPSATFRDLAGFDPDFFLYGEDVDFGLRITASGHTMALVPEASVRHRRGASSQLLSRKYVYNALRGNLIVTLKHARWYQLPAAVLGSAVITLALTVIAYRSGTKDAPEAAARAWIDFASRRWGGLGGRALTPANRPRQIADHLPQ